ncbi:MAG: helix-turn-helix transcriptional regulator [Cyclobacteriaceae bacterium]|nr:helix-turn-helix transcriptional regulator [Cytophagales bacterium]MCZ8329667.1 helix-turn-helix transcriptional regulator [Cyclobacteriaceae bacterium]
MQQPELGKQLIELRRRNQLTQEELASKSFVSARTIQRIEAGEVIPRLSTVKILWRSLGEEFVFQPQTPTTMETTTICNHNYQQQLLLAIVAGTIYLAFEIALTAMDISWLTHENGKSQSMFWVYLALNIGMVIAYVVFASGFFLLAKLFENKLLSIASVMMMVLILGSSVVDVLMFHSTVEQLSLPYAMLAIVAGVGSFIFGIALLRLQDGMGVLAKIAGILEIIMGVTLISVLFFFVSLLLLVPATLVEILLLYNAYEYLSKSTVKLPEQ